MEASDGTDEVSDGLSRTALTVAAQLGKQVAKVVQQAHEVAAAQRADELEHDVDWDSGSAADLEQFAEPQEHRASQAPSATPSCQRTSARKRTAPFTASRTGRWWISMKSSPAGGVQRSRRSGSRSTLTSSSSEGRGSRGVATTGSHS